jgi:hypothetical protein
MRDLRRSFQTKRQLWAGKDGGDNPILYKEAQRRIHLDLQYLIPLIPSHDGLSFFVLENIYSKEYSFKR